MTYQRTIRFGLGYLSIFSLQIGAWALVAPRSFYDSFPGLGRVWVAVDGPYNEHLIRDVGALNLAMLVVLIWAAVTLSPQLIKVAAAATLVWGVPHLAYHVINTSGLGAGDLAASLGGLGLFAAIPIALIVLAGKLDAPVPASSGR